MKDERKTKAQLAEELADLRLQVADLKRREARAAEAEAALRESEARYRAVVEDQTELICRFLPDCTLTFVNEAYCRYFGSTREEMTGINFLPLIPDEDRGTVVEHFASITPDSPLAEHEHRAVLPDGQVRWMHWMNRGIFDETGRLIEVQAVGCDVTERKQAEEALKASEERFRQVAENAQEWIWEADRDGLYTYVSPAVEKALGYKPDEIVGKKHFFDLFHPEDRATLKKAAFEVFARKDRFREFVNRNVHKRGQTVWLSTSGIPLLGEQGDLLGYRGADTDITDRRAAEEALRKASEEKSLILSSVSEEVVYHDRDMGIVWTNRAASESSGLTPEQLVGRMCYEVWHGRNQVCDGCPVQKAMDTGAPAETETTTPDGRVWRVHGYPVFGDGGKVLGAVEIVRDITDRKRAEDRLRLLSSAVEQAAEGIGAADLQGNLLFVNEALARMHGYALDELTAKHLSVFHAPEQMPSVEEANRQTRETGEFSGELWHVRRDGSVFPTLMRNSLLRDGAGTPVGMIGTMRDITDRKRAEEALRRSEENYRALFEESLDGILVVVDGRIVGANQAFADIRGRPLEELVGREAMDLVDPDERDAAAQSMQGVLAGKADVARDRRYRAQRPDGTVALVEVLSNRIDWEGRPAIQAIVRNVTERVRLEEELRQAQKMEAVGQLAGGIAHDFNNLMTGILCHADLLKSESPSPEDVREAADLIEGAARRAAELTGQLLGFARRGKRRDVAVDLNATARTSVRLLGRSLDPRIRVRMPFRDEHAFVRGDPVQMEQVVLNLAMNARDAMPEGGEMTLTIHTLDVAAEDCKSRPGAEPGRYVVLSVADTGCGIPEATRSRVFEPFFTTKPHGKGTGMGLAMVYGIVKDHGGWVEVDSEPGRGTTFRVFLPAAKAPADTGATPADIDLRAPPDAGRILVVDDEELVRNVVVRMLSGLGYEVATAADAHEAVEYYGRFGRDVSVVIIDLAMPKMDGLRCFTALRGLDPDVKALLATGWGNEDRVQDALDEGMAGLVRKPFQTKQLAKAVKQALTQ